MTPAGAVGGRGGCRVLRVLSERWMGWGKIGRFKDVRVGYLQDGGWRPASVGEEGRAGLMNIVNTEDNINIKMKKRIITK